MIKESTLNVYFLQQGVRLSSVTITFGWVGGGGPSFKGLLNISNTNQIRVLLVLLVAVTYPHHFYKMIVSCVTAR